MLLFLDLYLHMSKKKYKPKLKFKDSNITSSFNDLFWVAGRTSADILEFAALNKMPCFCYLTSTPITSMIYFHQKIKIHA